MSQQLTFDLNVDNQQAVSAINTFFDAFDAGVKTAGASLDKQFKDVNTIVSVRLEGDKLVAKELKNATSIGNKLTDTAKAIRGEFGKTPREIQNSIRLLKEVLSNTKKYKNGTSELTKEWEKLTRILSDARKEAADIKINDGMTRSITGANVAAGIALDAIRALGRGVADLAKQGVGMEVLMIQLKGFTGSTESADKAFRKFVEIAKKTPFNVKQVAEASKIMMGFGISAEESAHRVEQLSIVAAATGGELGHMARNLGQIQANQKAYTRDLMQFANQGIPIYQMLSEILGVTTQQVRELAEEGQIGFNEVAAALDLMTEKGSAYQQIAEDMDKTISARLEAMGSAITTMAGQFVYAFQEMDKALGGASEKTFAALIGIVGKVGEALKYIGDNANTLAPLFAAVGVAMAFAFGTAAIANLGAIGAALNLIRLKVMALTAVQITLNTAQAVFAALTGNFAAIALAAGVAAGAAYLFTRNTKDATSTQKDFNEELEKEVPIINGKTDSSKLYAFSLENVHRKQKELIEANKEEFDTAQKAYNMKIAGAERALQFLEMEATKKIQFHEAEIDRLDEKIEKEKNAQEAALEKAKEAHDIRMEGLNKELEAVRSKYDEELGLLDEETEYAKELREIKKQELQQKLKSGDLTRKEVLQIKEQLVQIDRGVKRRELMKQKAEEEAKVQSKINQEQESQKDILSDINKSYEDKVEILKKNKKTHQDAIVSVSRELKSQKDLVESAKAEELQAIYENRDAALSSLRSQINEAERLRKKMVEVYNQAKKARKEISDENTSKYGNATGGTGSGGYQSGRDNAFAGGPVLGGTEYTVNELGPEAFLSASGHLSMINAPAWGAWQAPTSGTVIPAHLTRQLDIPQGGIDLNNAAGLAGVNAAKGGGFGGIMSAIKASMGGNSYNNQVTIQSTNPNQTASDALVALNRVRRRR